MMNSPEPMTLGSPSQSPPSITGQYLPQYLLGEMSLNSSQAKNSPKFWVGGNSPPKSTNLARSFSLSQYDNQNQKYTHHGVNDKSESLFNTNTPHHHHHQQHLSGGGGHHHHHHHSNSYSQELAKPSGPPLNRLMDTINKPLLTITPQSNLTQNTPFNDSRSKYHDRSSNNDLSFTPTSRIAAAVSPPSPTQIDPFYTHGDSIKYGDTFDDTWVTVFGFPSSATSFILQEFSVYGQIIKYVPSGGNWMHIQYQTKFHAQKALSKNGKIIGNSMMIGVMPCIDKKVMQQSENTIKATNSQLDLSSTTTSASASSKTNEFLQQPAAKISRTASLRTSIRPLSASNRNLDDDNYDPKLPRKNNNVISKAMEYMFGW